MLRNLLRFLLIAFVLLAVRYLVVAIRNALTASRRPQPPAGRRPGSVPTEGTLRQDPVCGTFVAEAASVKETVGGAVVHFCSTACRDRYRQQG